MVTVPKLGGVNPTAAVADALWKSDAQGTMNQLSRIIANGSGGTPDEQAAMPDKQGSYGDLMDEIDRVLARPSSDRLDRPTSYAQDRFLPP